MTEQQGFDVFKNIVAVIAGVTALDIPEKSAWDRHRMILDVPEKLSMDGHRGGSVP